MTAITIRPEEPRDYKAIYTLTEAAFRDMPFSDGDEQDLIDTLRADGDLALSLVAETASGLAGHIAFSRVSISDGTPNWYDLGPVSVTPELQRQSIGAQLIERGIADLRAAGACGIVLLGNPDYYGRFGFQHDPALSYPGPPPQYFQRLVLEGGTPQGVVTYPPAFGSG
ncbi:N-acetyltransferase [Pontixanthobacter gangjinensis]|uniref:GNAT family N-acetyltransferase n=1 Tax=Pontixanthobacter gangjinensis TaxID=1028742 RepID=A0A6I4SJQ5_9SPHN|nr:N-acetyltransferase [Pontixanthobacter gangjinensis]MXO55923.1 GNAT family N-acetyltransferase [Pontixanthobacter gangjinensis]